MEELIDSFDDYFQYVILSSILVKEIDFFHQIYQQHTD